jgi:late competence protein required for DNA uptake (superfamily II DNA/RNA helicase)
MAQQMLGMLALEVLVLSGNSKALSSRIRRFKGGAHGVMVVPSSHCSGINLPMVTHIIVPYLPTACSTSDLRQLVGRVQRHGSRAHPRVVFVAEGMDRAAQEQRALASIER